MGNQTASLKKKDIICVSQNSSNSSGKPFYYSERFGTQGSQGFAFREVLYTSTNLMQWVKMQLLPSQDIGMEVHEDTDQFFFIDSGRGVAIVKDSASKQELPLGPGSVVIVSAGTYHNIINESDTRPMVLYTMYAPAEHKHNTLQKTKPK
jgi:mannose-6-phosphate isomerase-like protein (cupin superfamily)